MSRERNLRLVCACGRALADVLPPLHDVEVADRDEVALGLQIKGRRGANMVATRFNAAGPQPTQWWIAHPEALDNWTYSWGCQCGRKPTLKEATIRSWWLAVDVKSYPKPWRVDHVLDT